MKIAVVAALLAFLALVQEPAPPPRPDPLAQLAWMAGSWHSEGRIETEELWLAPKGGLMLGLHREFEPKSAHASFEYLRIQAGGPGVQGIGGIDYHASPGGGPSTAFRLVEVSASHAVFSNPEHDFPQQLIYRLEDGELVARVEGDVGGRTQSSEWRWKRAQ
jgi:hypothetical protein